MKKLFCLLALTLLSLNLTSCGGSSPQTFQAIQVSDIQPQLYSSAGVETDVTFTANIRTPWTDLAQLQNLSTWEKEDFLSYTLPQQTRFLFGPLTHRNMGGPQRGEKLDVDWTQATVVDNHVVVPMTYNAKWILNKKYVAQGSFQIPFPLSVDELTTTQWKSCTDSAPEHQTSSFYWYFWDPTRYGCDHVLNTHYQMITVTVGAQTPNSQNTFPEYQNLIKSNGLADNLQMTFAFGYVEDTPNPNPETDSDWGVNEYRKFVSQIRVQLGPDFKESAILQKEYLAAVRPEAPIGKRFEGTLNGVKVTINVVTANEIDQMDIFAQSFAHNHDSFFAWMGHSRVGGGFDANRFRQIVEMNPEYYSIVPDYQFVYWGGCNSYSYYTLPFFDMKAKYSNGTDVTGTKGLDILANGLPSLFSFNADNAVILFDVLMDWTHPTSYQNIVDRIEARAAAWNYLVLVTVLGDEDNQ